MTQTPLPDAPEKPRKKARSRKAKPSCADCFFGCRGLCALDLGEPCSTYRPNSPEGLTPPAQPMLLLRDEPGAPADRDAQLTHAA